MKRVFSLILCISVFVFCAIAYADVDLSGMSFDELVALKDKINLAIWNSEEWQEVTVPQGVWEVGADIPAGKWTIKANEGGICTVTVGTELKDGGSSVKLGYFEIIYSKSSFMYSDGDLLEFTTELHDGEYVQIESTSAIFTPFSDKQSLGFK